MPFIDKIGFLTQKTYSLSKSACSAQ